MPTHPASLSICTTTRLRSFTKPSLPSIPSGQCTARLLRYSHGQPYNSRDPFTGYHHYRALFPQTTCAQPHAHTYLKKPSNKLRPFATAMAFGSSQLPMNSAIRSFRFSPPLCYQASQAGTSSLLRTHLPPYTASLSLGSLLVPHYPLWERCKASPVKFGPL